MGIITPMLSNSNRSSNLIMIIEIIVIIETMRLVIIETIMIIETIRLVIIIETIREEEVIIEIDGYATMTRISLSIINNSSYRNVMATTMTLVAIIIVKMHTFSYIKESTTTEGRIYRLIAIMIDREEYNNQA